MLRLDTPLSLYTCAAGRTERDTWRGHSCFRGRAARRSAWARRLPMPFPQARAVLDEIDAALLQSSRADVRGPGGRADADRECPAGSHGSEPRGDPRARGEAGLHLARDAAFVAGHSLGEYSALAAAGIFSVADAARLLRVRGDAMQNATPVGVGAMAALLGLDAEAAAEVARDAAQGEVCDVANDNGGAQVVVSGHKAAVERAVALAPAKGAKRAVMLTVSAPFHCALDGAGRRGDARSARRGRDAGARGAGRRQCRGRAADRSGADPRRACAPGDRAPCAGANASRRWPGRGSTASTRSAPARC